MMKSITSPNQLYPNSSDSHCHLFHLRQKGLDILQSLEQWRREGLYTLMNIALEPNEEDWQWHLQISRSCEKEPDRYPKVLLSVGLHPHDADGSSRTQRLSTDSSEMLSLQDFEQKILDPALELVAQRAAAPEVQAIGETGLDYYGKNHSGDGLQKKSLVAHIQLAQKHNKVLVIHNRESDVDILEILSAHDLPAGGIMHCFSGNPIVIKPLLERNFFFSFAGNLTYKNAENLRQAASQIPAERILVETDAPFLAPQPVRGQINHPGFIGHTLEILAQCQNMSSEQMLSQIQENWQNLFVEKGFQA